jgi:hypothetical protein
MQCSPQLEVAQRALRQRVCTQCSDRPAGSETLSPSEARECETKCAIFTHLPKVQHVVVTTTGMTLGPYEQNIRDQVCQFCELGSMSGDWCDDRMTRVCPLSRYTSLDIETLERLWPAP